MTLWRKLPRHKEGRNFICLSQSRLIHVGAVKNCVINYTLCLTTAPSDHELTAAQIVILRQTMNKIREAVQRLATDHRDLHSTVSKVGKAIDRVSNCYEIKK